MTERRTIYTGKDDLWDRFAAACKSKGVSPSQSLREHMAKVVAKEERKKR